MYKKLIATSAAFYVASFQLAQAQQVVSGAVKDNKGLPIDAANVALLKASDSTWLQSALTDTNGTFRFTESSAQSLLLSVYASGFARQFQVVKTEAPNMVTLQQSSAELEEVVVRSKAPELENKLGMLVVNFDDASRPAGGNALDVLKKSPGVVVGGDGSISMNGKGVLVIIDGRKTYLSGDDLTNYLKSLSAEDIAKVELTGQPTAKYDAEGTSGIISIVTTKNKLDGINGNVSLSYNQGQYPGTFNSTGVNYRKNKLSLYARSSYLHAIGFLSQDDSRQAYDVNNALISQLDQHVFFKEVFEDYNLSVGGDYAATDKFSFGGNLSNYYHPNSQKDVADAVVTDWVTRTTVFNKAENNHGFIRRQLHGNGYAKYQPAEGHNLSIDLDYIYYDKNEHQLLSSKNYDEYGNLLADGLEVSTQFPLQMNVFVAKADYTGSFRHDIQVEAGGKASFQGNQTDAVYYKLDNGSWVYDATMSNYLDYRENINALYVNASKKIGKQWQADVGLRAENTNLSMLQKATNEKYYRSYTNLFPTAFLGWEYTDNQSLELNVGRRLERPGYYSLNPFVFYTSQYASHSGNPYLMPAYRNSIALKHNYKNHLFTEVSYAHVTNIINDLIQYDSVTQSTFTSPQNISNKENARLSITYSSELYPWWQIRSTYDAYYNDYKDSNGVSIISALAHSFSISNEFSYKTWSFSSFYNVNSSDVQSLTETNTPNQWMQATITKKLWNDTATVKLQVDDPFDLYRYNHTNRWDDVVATSSMQFATQRLSLSFTYNVGKKLEIKKREQSLEEERRM